MLIFETFFVRICDFLFIKSNDFFVGGPKMKGFSSTTFATTLVLFCDMIMKCGKCD